MPFLKKHLFSNLLSITSLSLHGAVASNDHKVVCNGIIWDYLDAPLWVFSHNMAHTLWSWCNYESFVLVFSWFSTGSCLNSCLLFNFELYIVNLIAPVMVVNYYNIFRESNQVTDIFEKRGLFINNMIHIFMEAQVWIQIQLLADHSQLSTFVAFFSLSF